MSRVTTARRRLEAPSRLAGPKPKPVAAPPPDPFAIGRLGPWTILRLSDQTGKRGWARCGHCSEIREISLVGPDPPSCGCLYGLKVGAP
jgi:hypothetical protein